MKSESVERIKDILQDEIKYCDENLFNDIGAVDEWCESRLIFAAKLMETITGFELAEATQEKAKWEDVHVFEVKKNMFDMAQSLRCSNCGRIFTEPYTYYVRYSNYCPYCGAEMQNGDETRGGE